MNDSAVSGSPAEHFCQPEGHVQSHREHLGRTLQGHPVLLPVVLLPAAGVPGLAVGVVPGHALPHLLRGLCAFGRVAVQIEQQLVRLALVVLLLEVGGNELAEVLQFADFGLQLVQEISLNNLRGVCNFCGLALSGVGVGEIFIEDGRE